MAFTLNFQRWHELSYHAWTLASRCLPAKYVFSCKLSHGEVKLSVLLILLRPKNSGQALAAIQLDTVFSNSVQKSSSSYTWV